MARWSQLLMASWLALLVLAGTSQGAVIYGVNVTAVVCDGNAVNVEINRPSDSTVVPFFLRTSGREATVQFSMQNADGSATSISTVTKTLTSWSRRLSAWLTSSLDLLQALPGFRPPKAWRIQQPEVLIGDLSAEMAGSSPSALEMRSASTSFPEADSSCEEFFLLDGRSPVDLPDTWGEAKSSFVSICLDAGVEAAVCTSTLNTAFPDFAVVDLDQAFRAGPALCESLLAWASQHYELFALKPRRLKSSGGGGGYYTSGGVSAANGWSASSGRSFGWSSSSLGARYTSTRTLAYGYSGVLAASAITALTLRRSSLYWHSNNVDSSCSSSDCSFVAGADESLYADDFFDLMVTVSSSTSLTWPQVLTIYSIAGPFVDNVEICSTAAVSSDAGLYFGLASPDELVWEEDTDLGTLIASIVGGVVGGCLLLSICFCCCKKCCDCPSPSSWKSWSTEPERERGMEEVMPQSPVAPSNGAVYGNPSYVTATVVQGTAVPSDPCSKTE